MQHDKTAESSLSGALSDRLSKNTIRICLYCSVFRNFTVLFISYKFVKGFLAITFLLLGFST